MFKQLPSLFPWKHGKTKTMAGMTMDESIIVDQELLPCEICGRTFLPEPLRRHSKVCEKNATRKRKVFDSLKQRVEGTDLAQFHQKTYLRKPEAPPVAPIVPDIKITRSKWKEKHLELVNAIRAAKGASGDMVSRRSTTALSTPSSNERCPSCDRHFGPKAFDRHVEWCKERKARIQKSPASVQMAKERLEARTKYRVPPLRQSKRSLNREKYSSLAKYTQSPSGVKSVSSISLDRSPSVRKPRSVVDLKRDRTEERVKVSEKPVPKEPVIKKTEDIKSPDADYNPFLSAERQLQELLECDDLKPYSTPTRPHTTDTVPTKKSPPARKKLIKSAEKRESVIDPPTQFEDKLSVLNDNFEMIESFINENFRGEKEPFYLHPNQNGVNLKTAERKYSDDMSSIDPELINENDNLSIPDHLKSNSYSPDSDATLQNDVDVYSVQYDRKIASLEPLVLPKTEIIKDLKRSVSLLEETDIVKDPSRNDKGIRNVKTAVNKPTGSVRSSSGPNKKNTNAMKRSISLAEPVGKARGFKTKAEVESYLNKQERINVEKEKEIIPKGDNLFLIDDQMFEEYKKYEEMYLMEKAQKNLNQQKKANDNFLSNDDVDSFGQVSKISGDSAYGSLNRKTPKVRARATKLTPLEPQKQNGAESPGSSSSELSPTMPVASSIPQRLSKFCHECGSKYPLNTAKFCVECGIRRLVL